MKRLLPALLLALALLTAGCTDDAGPHKDSTGPSGPPTISESPSPQATDLANRYHAAGGDRDVVGIRQAKDKGGVLVLTVWTQKKSGYEQFDDFATNLASFLAGEGASLDQGYVLNVYGPDGTRLHTYDTTPEKSL
ncbi:hypothetical protein OG883_23390 [Streptomyces sp. NBC_01142]|uniref:hypothetical protein n=1 Tax=Streptomyces sp. NBC_01142 TaxID=2975865 RepID=UPI002256B33F|nr:hypothetical protein [Streptomyces sp. NBC_01142]MCX4822789.1 hypothetical protein [Streptomyces sp. NBC_01142]